MNRFQEVEVKLHIDDLEMVAARLVAAGAERSVPRVFERNIRYEDAEKSLTGQGIVLRLRQDMRTKFTYKEPAVSVDDELATRFEAEVEVSDFEAMDVILKKLGYQPYVVYEKYRTTYTLDRAEIVLDEMPYGNFVEVEGQPEMIRAVIDRLDLVDYPRFKTNYMVLFERVRAHLNLDVHNLTFENFEGVEVPAEAFLARDA